MQTQPLPSSEARAARFGFTCSRCSNCCHDKIIQLNPYEVARLARTRGLSTAAFTTAHTEDGAGVHLSRTDDGDCVFLGSKGCEVHADRPLVCRLYPLGRMAYPDGTESFSRVTPHPLSKGSFHEDGTIADFLASQGAGPFMEAASGYLRWFARARAVLGEDEEGEYSDTDDPDELLDMDSAIAAHCARYGEAEPANIEVRLLLHMQILDLFLADLEEGRP